jgi:hypothetical protein
MAVNQPLLFIVNCQLLIVALVCKDTKSIIYFIVKK